MKKILSAVAISLVLATSAAYANQHMMKSGGQHCSHHKDGQHGKKYKKRAMHHANPMPNLMMVVKKKSAELGLSQEQNDALAKWRDANHMALKQQVENVVRLENEIMTASLNGEDETSLMARMDEMLAVRRSIAERKVNCRDNLKKILTAEQYDTVISTYKAHRAAHQEKMKQHRM